MTEQNRGNRDSYEQRIDGRSQAENSNIILTRLQLHLNQLVEYEILRKKKVLTEEEKRRMRLEEQARQPRIDKLAYDILTTRKENPNLLPEGVEVSFMSTDQPIHPFSQNLIVLTLPFYRTSDNTRIVNLDDYKRIESTRRSTLTDIDIKNARVKLRLKLNSLSEELQVDQGYSNSLNAYNQLLEGAKPMVEVLGDTLRRMISEIKTIDKAIQRQRDAREVKLNEEITFLHEIKGQLIYYMISKRMQYGSEHIDLFRITRQQDSPNWIRITVSISEQVEKYTQINLEEMKTTNRSLHDQILTLIGDDPLDGVHIYTPPSNEAEDD